MAERIDKNVVVDANENPTGNRDKMKKIEPSEVFNHIDYMEFLIFSLRKSGLINQSKAIEYLQGWPHEDLTNRFCILEHAVNLTANRLEKMAYHTEKSKKSRSRLHDVSHIIYGRYADVFVSNDEKLLQKARAIYSFLGVSTKVLAMEEFSAPVHAE